MASDRSVAERERVEEPPPWAQQVFDGVDGEPAKPLLRRRELDVMGALRRGLIKPAYLVHPIIAAKGTSIVSGRTATGKSTLLLDAALHLIHPASECPDWHGLDLTSERGGTVAIVDYENDADTFDQRVGAWLDARGWLTEERLGYVADRLELVERPDGTTGAAAFGGSSDRRDGVRTMADGIDQLVAARRAEDVAAGRERPPLMLVIIDTLAATSLREDANAAAEAERVLSDAYAINIRHGVPVVVASHPSKDGGTGTESMKGGKSPSDQHVVAGSQRMVDGAYSVSVLAHGVEEDERLLVQVKARTSAADRKVRKLRLIERSVPVPAGEVDVGGQVKEVGDGEKGLPVFDAATAAEIQESAPSKFDVFLDWLEGQALDGADAGKSVKALAALDGCPVKADAISKYIREQPAVFDELGYATIQGASGGAGGAKPRLLYRKTE